VTYANGRSGLQLHFQTVGLLLPQVDLLLPEAAALDFILIVGGFGIQLRSEAAVLIIQRLCGRSASPSGRSDGTTYAKELLALGINLPEVVHLAQEFRLRPVLGGI
jgi:hypothetical protein